MSRFITSNHRIVNVDDIAVARLIPQRSGCTLGFINIVTQSDPERDCTYIAFSEYAEAETAFRALLRFIHGDTVNASGAFNLQEFSTFCFSARREVIGDYWDAFFKAKPGTEEEERGLRELCAVLDTVQTNP